MSDPKRKNLKRVMIAVTLVLVMVAIAVTGWATLSRRASLTYYEAPADHFKYGSVGTEAVEGIPYWIWVVLPRLFPEKLPGSGGYTSLGLTWEEGREMPIGLTKETIGFDRVGLNCAACHVGTVRTAELANPTFILGDRVLSSMFNGMFDFYLNVPMIRGLQRHLSCRKSNTTIICRSLKTCSIG